METTIGASQGSMRDYVYGAHHVPMLHLDIYVEGANLLFFALCNTLPFFSFFLTNAPYLCNPT
ncbi:hypothetical protein PsorP6_001678 [Peronosclerospora sorghi]|uniref:Uncharacterized protein n=1 Tax=Peronosclerospora sorghi TaxID=230839 RepID=A0ACC0WWP8_9STRA|nr:hypothetical protein PsorP6_001678 [Peronosclerospora sorghi]